MHEPTIDLDGDDDVNDGYRGNLAVWFDDADDDELAEETDVPDVDEYTPETFDEYLKASVMIPKGDDILKAQVVSRRKDHNGNPIGRSNSNPVLDTRQYVVEFEDGAQEHYTANLIAENMYTQVDKQGKEFALMSEIVDHASDATAIGADDGFYLDRYGKTKPKMTTRGWKLLVEWKDGNMSWVALKDMKESFPVETAEYAVANKIVHEPAFAWWVPETLRRRPSHYRKGKE